MERNLTEVVEQLGRVKADIANLKTVEESLKATLIGAAANDIRDTVIDGPLFRSSVSFTDKKVVDYKAILATLVEHRAVPKRVIELLTAQNTQIAKGVPCVRVTARKAA